jgi:tRNA-dihydrouridine synthase A
MLPAAAVVHNPGNVAAFYDHHPEEHPLALQLGGMDPDILGEAAYLASNHGGFCEVNLNCGCPSQKAKKGCFGAELMNNHVTVKQIVSQMIRRVDADVAITVKCRLGVTPGRSTPEDLRNFIATCREAGAQRVILHARDCLLKGLSPAQNRTIPPLRYVF